MSMPSVVGAATWLGSEPSAWLTVRSIVYSIWSPSICRGARRVGALLAVG